MEAQSDPQGGSRQLAANACEACRAAKVRCQASSQLGICRRCVNSKRECIVKTGPRTRRPRQSKLNKTAVRPPPPPGPSKTFTIDVPMPAEDSIADSLDFLHHSHETSISNLLPSNCYASDDEEDDEEEGDDGFFPSFSRPHASSTAGSVATSHSSLQLGASALQTPPASLTMASSSGPATMGVRPRFNLDSAAALLGRFRSEMLPHFPAVALGGETEGEGEGEGEDASSVAGLAGQRPFLLLAVLAAASGSRTLQGHSLYDEEFRKILGLKFVAGGERSLELLQGLLIYCAWYPFQLRPKSKQAFQYVRMTTDLVHDLDLDQDPRTEASLAGDVSEIRLEEVRAYLATYYLTSNFSTIWKKTTSLPYTEYTAKCCDLLESTSSVESDLILVWLVRVQHIAEEISDAEKNNSNSQNKYQVVLMLKGMDAQLNEWERRMPRYVHSNTSFHLSLLSVRAFLSGASLLKLPSTHRRPVGSSSAPTAMDSVRLAAAIPHIRAFLDFAIALPAAKFKSFTVFDWGAFIAVVILGFRMSFSLPACPGWDDGWARRELEFGNYLERMLRMGEEEPDGGGEGTGGKDRGDRSSAPANGKQNMDVLSASKVILGVVRQKYEKRLARVERRNQGQQQPQSDMQSSSGICPGTGSSLNFGWDPIPLDKDMHGCPMIDGSLESYLPYWSENFTAQNSSMLPGTGFDNPLPATDTDTQQPSDYPDLWAALTTAWPQTDLDFNRPAEYR